MWSFIIPVKDEEKYIADCLRSIYRQPIPEHFEVIVVDNNCTDATVALVRRNFSETRIVAETNPGTNPARQAGYRAAVGDVLIFLDADVRLPVGWLVRVRRILENDPRLVAVSGPYKFYDFTWFWKTGAVVYFWLMALWGRLAPRILGFMPVMIAGTMVIKKSALDKVGGLNTALKFYGDDTDTAMRLSRAGKVIFSLNLWVYSSARRFRKVGVLHVLWHYIINHLWLLIWHKPKSFGQDTESSR
jgi:glycosyltransferase involved in cell wall biosynthesis